MLSVILLPREIIKSSCFRYVPDLIVRILREAGGIVGNVVHDGCSWLVVGEREVQTVRKLSFTVDGLSTPSVHALLHSIEDTVSLQEEGIRVIVSESPRAPS